MTMVWEVKTRRRKGLGLHLPRIKAELESAATPHPQLNPYRVRRRHINHPVSNLEYSLECDPTCARRLCILYYIFVSILKAGLLKLEAPESPGDHLRHRQKGRAHSAARMDMGDGKSRKKMESYTLNTSSVTQSRSRLIRRSARNKTKEKKGRWTRHPNAVGIVP